MKKVKTMKVTYTADEAEILEKYQQEKNYDDMELFDAGEISYSEVIERWHERKEKFFNKTLLDEVKADKKYSYLTQKKN